MCSEALFTLSPTCSPRSPAKLAVTDQPTAFGGQPPFITHQTLANMRRTPGLTIQRQHKHAGCCVLTANGGQ